MKLEFKPEDFKEQSFAGTTTIIQAAYDANKRLAEMLSSATVVYNNEKSPKYNWSPTLIHDDTHKALLINIEPIVKEPCKHEDFMEYPRGVVGVWPKYGKCNECGVELVAEWKAKT